MEARTAKKEPVQERKVVVTILSADKRKPVVLETWRYWEIVGELRWMGVDYLAATDAAKWCQKAKPGETCEILPHSVIVEVMDCQHIGPLNIIKMEVTNG